VRDPLDPLLPAARNPRDSVRQCLGGLVVAAGAQWWRALRLRPMSLRSCLLALFRHVSVAAGRIEPQPWQRSWSRIEDDRDWA